MHLQRHIIWFFYKVSNFTFLSIEGEFGRDRHSSSYVRRHDSIEIWSELRKRSGLLPRKYEFVFFISFRPLRASFDICFID
jgi:hypothetical protein